MAFGKELYWIERGTDLGRSDQYFDRIDRSYLCTGVRPWLDLACLAHSDLHPESAGMAVNIVRPRPGSRCSYFRVCWLFTDAGSGLLYGRARPLDEQEKRRSRWCGGLELDLVISTSFPAEGAAHRELNCENPGPA